MSTTPRYNPHFRNRKAVARPAALSARGVLRGPPRSTMRPLLSSFRSARGQIEREVLAPGWMEGRSGTVVVLATGIDPSPLVLPPLYPPLLACPLLPYPRFTPFFPSLISPLLRPPPPAPHSLMHSSAHIQRGYTHTHMYIRIPIIPLARPRRNPLTPCCVPVSLPLSWTQSRSFLTLEPLILNIQIRRISGTLSIISSYLSLFMRFLCAISLPYPNYLHIFIFLNTVGSFILSLKIASRITSPF